MVALVTHMLELHQQLAADRQIDNLVYELYGLSDDEIQAEIAAVRGGRRRS